MLYIGADHAGFSLKDAIKAALAKHHVAVKDLSSGEYDADDDYPDIAATVARRVTKDRKSFGILLCGSSLGVCIAANKIKGARAASIRSLEDAMTARQHNDANIICLAGGEFVDAQLANTKGIAVATAVALILTFVHTPASKAARHKRRIQKIRKLER